MQTITSQPCPMLPTELTSNGDIHFILQVKKGEKHRVSEMETENRRHEVMEMAETKNTSNLRKRGSQEELPVDIKKAKVEDSFGREAGSVDTALGTAAEIILVLAGMGQMRAGRVPTSVEMDLMQEAQQTLGSLISNVAPQDLMSNQLADSLILEMKSHKDLEQKALAAKMVKKEKKALDVISEASVKTSAAAFSTDGNLAILEPGVLANNGFFESDVQQGGVSHSEHLEYLGISAVSSTKAFIEKLKTPLQAEEEDYSESQMYKLGLDSFKFDSEILDEENIEVSQSLKESSASPPFHCSPVDGVGVNQQPNESLSGLTIHKKLVEIVQKLMPPPSSRASSAVSNAYIASPVPCAICYVVVKDETGVLLCDGCENAFHLKCLQPFYLKHIPEGDWYCPKCVVESGGDSQLSKYGPINRPLTVQGPIKRGSGSQAGSKRHHAKSQARKIVSQSGLDSSGAVSQTLSDTVKHISSQGSAGIQKNIVQEMNTTQSTAQGPISVQLASGPEASAKWMDKDSNVEDAKRHQRTSRKVEKSFKEDHKIALQSRTGNLSTSSPSVLGSAEVDPEPSKVSAESLVVAQGALSGKELTSSAVPNSISSTNNVKDPILVEWSGDMLQLIEEKAYYAACRVGGCTFKLNDSALFRPETPDIPPYIARIQVLWEDIATGSKWVRVNWCYYPNDIPTTAGFPEKPEEDEIYESNHCDNNLIGSIQGPCKVLSPQLFYAEKERRIRLQKTGVSTSNHDPIFLCRWLFDAPKAIFRRFFGMQ